MVIWDRLELIKRTLVACSPNASVGNSLDLGVFAI